MNNKLLTIMDYEMREPLCQATVIRGLCLQQVVNSNYSVFVLDLLRAKSSISGHQGRA